MVDLDQEAAAVPGRLVEAVRAAGRVLAVSHEQPDGDTLGAALAVVLLAEALGAEGEVLCADPVPDLYRFLPQIDRVRTEPSAPSADLVVLVDCGAVERVGSLRQRHPELFEASPLAIIDHHASNGGAGPLVWIDPDAAATCELVALLALRLGVPLGAADGVLATALLAGIVMDTATFAHPNTTPRTLAVAAALVAAGAPLSEIARRLYRTKPTVQLRLFGRVLDRLETAHGGRVVWSTLRADDLTATGASPAHSEGLIDLLAQAETADVAILFKDHGATTRVSIRTKPNGVDATLLAGRFGGGGHLRAAGATVSAPLEEACRLVLAEVARLLDEGSA